MESKTFIRASRGAKYPPSYTQPDQSMTIGDLIERHLDGSSVSNHQSEAVEDTNVESPMCYDNDLTDVPTVYQDGDYFAALETARRSISTESIDVNPRNLSSNEKVPTNPAQDMPGNSPVGQGT